MEVYCENSEELWLHKWRGTYGLVGKP